MTLSGAEEVARAPTRSRRSDRLDLAHSITRRIPEVEATASRVEIHTELALEARELVASETHLVVEPLPPIADVKPELADRELGVAAGTACELRVTRKHQKTPVDTAATRVSASAGTSVRATTRTAISTVVSHMASSAAARGDAVYRR